MNNETLQDVKKIRDISLHVGTATKPKWYHDDIINHNLVGDIEKNPFNALYVMWCEEVSQSKQFRQMCDGVTQAKSLFINVTLDVSRTLTS